MRRKLYALCKRLKSGKIACMFDESTMSVNWATNVAYLWTKPPKHYLDVKDPNMFIARINSKDCPIVIDFKNSEKCPRHGKGNWFFKMKVEKPKGEVANG